jgi:hypothetical protein
MRRIPVDGRSGDPGRSVKESAMSRNSRKPRADRQAVKEPAARIEPKSALEESGFPHRNTEQDRERKPGTRTRAEIRKGSIPGKPH